MNAHHHRTCWDVLGLVAGGPRRTSLAAISKAYRKRALETHPDRFPTAAGKAQATIHFQQVQRAYEQAKEEREEEEYASGPRTRAQKRKAEERKAADHFHTVNQVFGDVCAEIRRENVERQAKWKKDAFDSIVAAWPDEPLTCWNRFSHWQYQWFRSEFLATLKTQKPKLATYLSDQLANVEKEKSQQEETAARDAVSKLKREWADKDGNLEQWFNGCMQQGLYPRIVQQLRGKMRTTVEEWYRLHQQKQQDVNARAQAAARERMDNYNAEKDARVQAAADGIVAAYPDRAAIKSILMYLEADWPAILAKLPKKLQKTLEGMFYPRSKKLAGGALELENGAASIEE